MTILLDIIAYIVAAFAIFMLHLMAMPFVVWGWQAFCTVVILASDCITLSTPRPTARRAYDPLTCMDCGRDYEAFPADLNVTDEVWNRIVGRPGGVLCPNCLCARVASAGLSDVPAGINGAATTQGAGV